MTRYYDINMEESGQVGVARVRVDYLLLLLHYADLADFRCH